MYLLCIYTLFMTNRYQQYQEIKLLDSIVIKNKKKNRSTIYRKNPKLYTQIKYLHNLRI